MAEEVVSTYLQNKFSSILREAEEDPSTPLQIISRFGSIEKSIKLMCENTGSTINRSAGRASPIPVDLLYELIDALSECRIRAHQRHKAAAPKKGFFRVDFLSECFFMRTMRKRLDQIETKLKGTGPSPPGIVIEFEQTYPILDPSVIIGFESQATRIEALLMANNSTAAASTKEQEEGEGFTAIGIVGRCGCGKTALAQKVFASPRIQEEFSPRIWVRLSNMLFDNESLNPRVRVLNYILKEIGHHVSELEINADDFNVVNKLLEKLQRGLMGKRYLIVLDDACRVDEWYDDLRGCRGYAMGESFSHGLPKGSGGAIIVTSRQENVIRRTVGDKHIIRMETHLSNEICWEIFSNVVRQQGKMNPDHPTLNEMKDYVIRNSDGLPLAAKTLANIFSNMLKLWIPATKLAIIWGEDSRYWGWNSLPPPDELEEVAELLSVCWLDIKGNVDLNKLLPKTSYSAYLVFKLKEGSRGPEKAMGRIRFVRSEGNLEVVEECSVFIVRKKISGEGGHFAQPRGKGWMEIKLGEFFKKLGDDGTVEAAFLAIEEMNWKSGLIVRGIEVRPNY